MERITENSRIIHATPQIIYSALTTPEALETWQAPGNMTANVHHFDLRVGGSYQMSLYYSEIEDEFHGKTIGKEDRFTSRFLELIPGKKIVQAITFDTDNPDFMGEMLMEINLNPVENGTRVTFSFRNIPKGIKLADNEAGTNSSLEKLARYVE